MSSRRLRGITSMGETEKSRVLAPGIDRKRETAKERDKISY
jgi:hypothetical protein